MPFLVGDAAVKLGDRVYYIEDGATLVIVNAKTGELVGQKKLGRIMFGSPMVADGKIYMTNFWGDVYVVKAGGDSFELLSMNEMGNGSKPNGDAASCRSSIAVANGCLFIRTQDKLYCIGQ